MARHRMCSSYYYIGRLFRFCFQLNSKIIARVLVLAKIIPSYEMAKILLFTDICKSASSTDFFTYQICLKAILKNKILTNISE